MKLLVFEIQAAAVPRMDLVLLYSKQQDTRDCPQGLMKDGTTRNGQR